MGGVMVTMKAHTFCSSQRHLDPESQVAAEAAQEAPFYDGEAGEAEDLLVVPRLRVHGKAGEAGVNRARRQGRGQTPNAGQHGREELGQVVGIRQADRGIQWRP